MKNEILILNIEIYRSPHISFCYYHIIILYNMLLGKKNKKQKNKKISRYSFNVIVSFNKMD